MAIVPTKNLQAKNVEVTIAQENGKAVIQGKTSVPFKIFVGMILQRKIQMLFKDSQNEPVIVSSELLTKLASAPNDKVEDRGKLVIVTLAVGVVAGIFLSTAILLILNLLSIFPTLSELSIVLGVLIVIGIVGMLVGRSQGPSTRQKVYEQMEKISEMISR